jgi:hypothetical protein
VLFGKSTIVKKGLMLFHSVVGWDIIIFAPSTKWVKEKDGILESFLEELDTCILEEEAMSIVEWVSNLEGVNGISSSIYCFLVDLSWGESVLVKSIVILYSLDEVHFLSGNEVVSLDHDSFGLRMFVR